MNDTFTLIAQQTYSTEGSSPFVTCKRSVSILPLRYAVIGGAQSASSQQHAALPSVLNQSTSPARLHLDTARYAVLTLRDGYLYVFILRREKGWICEGAYQTYNSGLCKTLWPKPNDLSVGRMPDFGSRAIQIADPEDVDEARLLFTPDPLTPRMLAEIPAQRQLRETLRKLDIRRLIQSCSHTEHIIEAPALETTVADSVALTSASLTASLAQQLFPPPGDLSTLVGVASLLAPTSRQAQGFAVVLDDPIGITQELNAWRNQSVAQLQAFMDKTDSEGISNQRKHTIAFAIENLKLTLAEQAEQRYTQHANSLGVRYTDRQYASGNAHMAMASAGSYRSFRNPADQQRQQQQEIDHARNESWDKKYASSVDQARIGAFLTEFNIATRQADEIKDNRAADHLLWLNSTSLAQAFAYYDRHDVANGLLFETQLGVAVAGMNSTALGNAQLEIWSDIDSVNPHNLFWRGLALNQASATEQINLVLDRRSELATLDDSQLQGLIKALSDIYDKAHALVGEVNNNASASSIRLGGAVLLINTFGTRLLQSKPATLLDGPANTALALVFRARLGELGAQLHFERTSVPLSTGVKTKIGLAANKSFGDAMAAGSAGPMLEVRLGSTLALLELWNLKLKLERTDKDSREYIELAAAMIAVSAAGLELGAVAVGFADRSPNSAIRQAARLMGSELKLMAGVLAAASGSIGMVLDIQDVFTATRNNNYSLAAVYSLRATAQAGAALFSVAIGLATAGPYLERIIQLHGRNTFLTYTQKKSAQLALKMAFMLQWCIRINIIIFSATLILELLLPNNLQHYLRHSTFRQERQNGTSNSEAQELINLNKAIEDTL